MNITGVQQTYFPARVKLSGWHGEHRAGYYFFTGVTATAGNGHSFYEVGEYKHEDAWTVWNTGKVWLTKEGTFIADVR